MPGFSDFHADAIGGNRFGVNGGLGASIRRSADADEIERFFDLLFRHADPGTFVSLRSFDQVDRGRPPVLIEGVRISADVSAIAAQATAAADRAANAEAPAVFAPPIATFRDPRRARSSDVANGVTLSVDVDHGDTGAARTKLQHILGLATVIVASGGECADPATGEIHPKRHLHWRLTEPTRTEEEHAKLRDARWLAALLVGGDPTAAPPSHPLRWPGSWNRKHAPGRMARIEAEEPEREIELGDALERLQEAVEAAGLLGQGIAGPRVSGDAQAPLGDVAAALLAVPNGEATTWDDWNRLGMAAWRATGGSGEGLDAWAAWSAKSPKHKGEACRDRWDHFGTSPPTKVGAGTIFYLAQVAGWRRRREEPPPHDDGRPWGDRAPEAEVRREEAEAESEPCLPLVWFDEIQPVLEAKDFVQGLLAEGAAGVVYGESNAGKTFWATDLALHVAAGKPWNGRRVDQGGVVYAVLEGGNGFRNRVAAWREAHGLDDARLPFAAVPSSLNLLDPDADTPRLIQTIKAAAKRMGQPVKLVVVDTLARAMAGGNENAPDDMGALVLNQDAIRQETGAFVLFIHHSGKDAAKGARGHSSLRAAIDTEVEVTADETTARHAAAVVKQREMQKGDVFGFRLDRVVLGQNEHGEDVTTCVVNGGDAPPRAGRRMKLTETQAAWLKDIHDMFATPDAAAERVPVNDGPKILTLTRSQVRESFRVRGRFSANPHEPLTANDRTKLSEMLNALRNKGLICMTEHLVWLPKGA